MPLRTRPNHSWCVSCSTQCLTLDLSKCVRPRCNAKYCPKCVSDRHAAYFQIPTADGRDTAHTGHNRPRCRYCNVIHHLEFYKIAKNLPTNLTNITDLARIRRDIRINRLHDELSNRIRIQTQISSQS